LAAPTLAHRSAFGYDTSAMKCRFGHAHPPKLLKAATGHPTEPRGPRPFHCPDCQQVTMARTARGGWRVYQTPAEARAAGHLWPCKSCFG